MAARKKTQKPQEAAQHEPAALLLAELRSAESLVPPGQAVQQAEARGRVEGAEAMLNTIRKR